MWCWRRIEKISWTIRVRNEVWHIPNEEKNTVQRIKRRKCNWIGHVCVLKGKKQEKTRKNTLVPAGWPQGKEKVLKIGWASTRSHSVENSFWKKKQLTYRKTDHAVNESVALFMQRMKFSTNISDLFWITLAEISVTRIVAEMQPSTCYVRNTSRILCFATLVTRTGE